MTTTLSYLALFESACASLREALIPSRGPAPGLPPLPQIPRAGRRPEGPGDGAGDGAGGGPGRRPAGQGSRVLPDGALVDGALTLTLMVWCLVFALTALTAA